MWVRGACGSVGMCVGGWMCGFLFCKKLKYFNLLYSLSI